MAEINTIDRISSAALAIVTEEGPKAVTMRRVAADAGVTAMATYRHYPNRAALLRAVADTAFADIGKIWGNRNQDSDFASRLDGLFEDFLDFALGQPHLYAFLLTDYREDARRFPDDYQDGGSPAFAPVTDAIEQGMRDGILRPGDPLETTLAITSPAMGLVQLYLGGRIGLSEQGFRDLCKRTTDRVLNGLYV